jgi:SAM-dependent methyltransferase
MILSVPPQMPLEPPPNRHVVGSSFLCALLGHRRKWVRSVGAPSWMVFKCWLCGDTNHPAKPSGDGNVNTAENKAFWDERAKLGEIAGTQDLILKQLEQRAILGAIPSFEGFAGKILEVGCGLGETARFLAARREVYVDAIDSSGQMIASASFSPWVDFSVGDVMDPPRIKYHAVYSQRCLINLPSWEAQKQAIDAIADRVLPGGRFLMCEHSQDGLDAINEARAQVNEFRDVMLKPIEPPWHNRYFQEAELATVTSLRLVQCIPFSATYYFLSRVLNAKLSADTGREPAYDAPINRLALTLPAYCVDPRFAQARLWIWEKAA